VITPFFPSIDSFVGSYIFDQVNEIRKQTEFDVRIVKTVSLFSSEKDYEFNGFKVSIFKTIDFPFFIFPGLFNKINRKRFLDFLIKKGIKNVKYSHSHVTYPASYLVDDLICKKIVQHHGLDVLQLQNGRTGFAKKIQKNLLIKNSLNHLNKADLNIGVSQLVLDKLNEFQGYSPKNELVLYNGVDTSKFYYKEVKKNEVFTIGCVANFWEIKDQITLIKAVEVLTKQGIRVLLRLIGSGPTLESCKSYVLKKNLVDSIVFDKEIKHEKLNQFFNEIDLFALPSYYEALGCVYLESWATNTPFISVKKQGISEIIPKLHKEKSEILKSDFLNLSQKLVYFKKNKTNFEFDNKYDIKNTISLFLKQDLFNA
jgi:glycosyltransferase involved in cell wall biosynthesis